MFNTARVNKNLIKGVSIIATIVGAHAAELPPRSVEPQADSMPREQGVVILNLNVADEKYRNAPTFRPGSWIDQSNIPARFSAPLSLALTNLALSYKELLRLHTTTIIDSPIRFADAPESLRKPLLRLQECAQLLDREYKNLESARQHGEPTALSHSDLQMNVLKTTTLRFQKLTNLSNGSISSTRISSVLSNISELWECWVPRNLNATRLNQFSK